MLSPLSGRNDEIHCKAVLSGIKVYPASQPFPCSRLKPRRANTEHYCGKERRAAYWFRDLHFHPVLYRVTRETRLASAVTSFAKASSPMCTKKIVAGESNRRSGPRSESIRPRVIVTDSVTRSAFPRLRGINYLGEAGDRLSRN